MAEISAEIMNVWLCAMIIFFFSVKLSYAMIIFFLSETELRLWGKVSKTIVLEQDWHTSHATCPRAWQPEATKSSKVNINIS